MIDTIDYDGSNYVDIEGYTSLMYACKKGKRKIALKILDSDRHSGQNRECHPEQINNDNKTALIYACKNKMSDVALKSLNMNCHSGTLADPSIHEAGERLHHRGCQPQQTDNDNKTALIYACKNKMSDVALKLLNRQWKHWGYL
jgi:ankyrin repeat protein